ncbi:hypothetical protein ABTI79_20250, partial [Acinetobacter baumannii]
IRMVRFPAYAKEGVENKNPGSGEISENAGKFFVFRTLPARALGRWLRRREETSNSPYAGDSQAGRAAPKTARRKKETER